MRPSVQYARRFPAFQQHRGKRRRLRRIRLRHPSTLDERLSTHDGGSAKGGGGILLNAELLRFHNLRTQKGHASPLGCQWRGFEVAGHKINILIYLKHNKEGTSRRRRETIELPTKITSYKKILSSIDALTRPGYIDSDFQHAWSLVCDGCRCGVEPAPTLLGKRKACCMVSTRFTIRRLRCRLRGHAARRWP